MEHIEHCFAPVYDRNSRVLLLGTMPSPASREQGFYYSHPRNRMWRCLSDIMGQNEPRTPEEKKAFLLANGIAMWDVLKSCDIEGASDASIRTPEANDIRGLLSECGIRAIFTTGTKAHALYERYLLPVCGRKDIPLPSTSPANAARSLGQLEEAYSVILTYLH